MTAFTANRAISKAEIVTFAATVVLSALLVSLGAPRALVVVCASLVVFLAPLLIYLIRAHQSEVSRAPDTQEVKSAVHALGAISTLQRNRESDSSAATVHNETLVTAAAHNTSAFEELKFAALEELRAAETKVDSLAALRFVLPDLDGYRNHTPFAHSVSRHDDWRLIISAACVRGVSDSRTQWTARFLVGKAVKGPLELRASAPVGSVIFGELSSGTNRLARAS